MLLVMVAFAPDASASFIGGSGNQLAAVGFGPKDIGVIVNDDDPLSVRIANYYKEKRRIPNANMIHIQFKPGQAIMSRMEFQKIKAVTDAVTPRNVQAYALTWTIPYRVDCMSITTAFAFGFDARFCAKSCGVTRMSPYFNSPSRRPYDDYRLRPTMALAGRDFEEVKKLIQRGVESDGTFPRATGYLVSTSDKNRNVRAVLYPQIIKQYMGSPLDLRLVKADFIHDRANVLFYFTGTAHVKALGTIQFDPGAIADHLTSFGGQMNGTGQMSSLRWLEAGATGSYGTVVEPCNYLTKFPNPGVVINYYIRGETLIESYWKSVAMPGQGIFIGEPLAAPYAPRYGRHRNPN
ncbi:MAG: TIGR03790 family protein [Sulfuricaulis sp.]